MPTLRALIGPGCFTCVGRLASASGLLLAISIATGCARPPVEVDLPDVRLRVDPARGAITIARADGTVVLQSLGGGSVGKGTAPHVGFAFEHADPSFMELLGSFLITDSSPAWQGVRGFHDVVKRSDGITFAIDGPDGGGSGSLRRTSPGTVALTLTSPSFNHASASFACGRDERFIGFGAMPEDVEHHGTTVPLWVSEQGVGRVDSDDSSGAWFEVGTRHQTYFPVPFFVSSHDYGVRADTTTRSIFSMCSESPDAWRVEAWEGTIALHVFVGDSPGDVLARHSDLEGRAPVPPPFAFAPWNDAVFGSANVRRIAGIIRQNHIPSSVIWTEDWAGGVMDSGGGYHLTYDWTVDRTLYPDFEQLASDLHGEGFKFLGYFNTFVLSDGPNFASGSAGKFLVEQPDGTPYVMAGVPLGKNDALVDLTNPAARTWMAQFMSDAIALGLDGWMADYGEWLPADAKLASGEPAPSVHNRYPLLWQELNESVMKAHDDGVDRLFFVRSGYTGSQPIAHQIVWAGDQNTDFSHGDGLPSVLPIMLGLGVAGMPYVGSDIAGYTSPPGVNPSTKELFFRWSALSALTPVMRTHHGSQAMQNWSFDSDADTLAHYKRWATVHMQLHPYLLAAATEAAASGMPIMRQLGLVFPTDASAWTQKDEYLLGPSLLVAPVIVEGATDRSVYFPRGHWVRLFSQGSQPEVDGPATMTVPAPLGELPVYAAAGTVLVLLPARVETLAPSTPPVIGLGDVADDREIVIVAGSDGSFTETSGLSYQLASRSAPAAGATMAWNGQPLTACAATAPVAPCGGGDGSGQRFIASVAGPGTLTLSDGSVTFVAQGGQASRALQLTIVW